MAPSTSTSASVLPDSDPTAIIVPDIPQDYCDPDHLRSRFAKRYFEITQDRERAKRLDQCGRFREKRDINGHRAREYQHCMDCQCAYCAVRYGKTTFERWKGMIQLSTGLLDTAFTYVEASIPHTERDRGSAAAEFEALDDRLIDSLLQTGTGISPRWEYTPGYQGNNLILRLLYLDDNIPTNSWAAMFPPKATVHVMLYHPNQLAWAFQFKLLAVSLAKDANDRAEQSALFAGMRRFRAKGISCGRDEEPSSAEELFADTPLPANISLENDFELTEQLTPALSHNSNTCPKCGERYHEESQWFAKDAPNPRPEEIRWYRRPPPDPLE